MARTKQSEWNRDILSGRYPSLFGKLAEADDDEPDDNNDAENDTAADDPDYPANYGPWSQP